MPSTLKLNYLFTRTFIHFFKSEQNLIYSLAKNTHTFASSIPSQKNLYENGIAIHAIIESIFS